MRIDRLNQVLRGIVVFLTSAFMMACGENNPDNPEPPSPDPNENNVITHVYSEDAASEATVKEVRSDGTVILDVSSTKVIPNKGDIIVSGITKAAPYGFLYHVESVQQDGNQIVLKTSVATLNEILPDAHINQPLVFNRETGSRVDSSTRSKDFDLFEFKEDFTFPEEFKPSSDAGTFTIENETYPEYIQGKVSIKCKIGGTFIYDSDGGIPDRCGITLEGSLSTKLDVEMGVKAPWEEKLGDVDLEPIAFSVGPVPVVICPAIEFRYGIKPKGKMYMKWTPIDIEEFGFETHLIWNKEPDIYGEHWDFGASKDSDLSDWSWKKFFKDMANLEVGLTGSVEFAVWPEVRFKLYDAESVSLAAGISPYASLEGTLALKWKAEDWSLDDLEVKDELSLSAGVKIPLEGKLEFNNPLKEGDKIGGKLETDIGLLEVPLAEGATFIPAFNDFVVYPEDEAKERESVHVSANKGRALLSLFAEYEDDYGFCMAQIRKDENGNNLPKEWEYYSLKDKYAGSEYGIDQEYKVEMDIPTINLEPNASYDLRPYTTLMIYSSPTTFKRKGGKFKTGGTTNEGGGIVIDIPGEDL